MDVNGTKFHLFLGRRDWQPLAADHAALEWDDPGAALRLKPLVFRFPTPPGDYRPLVADRRGAGQDRYGHWYWIDPDKETIRFLSAAGGGAQRYWPPPAGAVLRQPPPEGDFRPATPPALPAALPLAGLAVTGRHYLVAGVRQPGGLLIFDLVSGGPPFHVAWPQGVAFEPYDLAPASDDGLWILDRKNRRVWRLDHNFQVSDAAQALLTLRQAQEEDFHDLGGGPRLSAARFFPAGVSLDLSLPLEDGDPLAIEALPDGGFLILESDPAVVRRYLGGLALGAADVNAAMAGKLDGPYTLLGHDLAFLPDAAAVTGATPLQPGQLAGRLFLTGSDGNQSFEFHLLADEERLVLRLQPVFYPMRLFAGKALTADFARSGVYYDLPDRWAPLIEQSRPRFLFDGVLEMPPLDGVEPGCAWHRLFLDGCLPPETGVLVESRAADETAALPGLPWQAEPRLYRRAEGSELPHFESDPLNASPSDAGVWELLFQRAEGRYLQLRLTLQGSGRVSPRIHALRIYYPRFSYLKEYLPAVYRADETSASFLDRFLANAEGLYTALEGRIEMAHTLFDIRSAPAEYLDWLADWLGLVLEADWEETRRRLFIKHAMLLFREHGTLEGLLRSIRLAVDLCPDERLFEGSLANLADRPELARGAVRIVESYLTRAAPGVAFGDPNDLGAPVLAAPGEPWTPAQGAEPLHGRWRDFLERVYPQEGQAGLDLAALNAAWGTEYSTASQLRLPPVTPLNEAMAYDWQRFLRLGLSFNYSEVYPTWLDPGDEQAYQAFLARRYRQVSRLNAAHQLGGSGWEAFSKVRLPQEDDFPASGQRLYDWIQFVTLVISIRRRAHQFTVLAPIRLSSDLSAQQRTVDRIRRVVDLQKPAHTRYVIKPYWALFRVGEARLGLDTFLDQGSRFVALTLGRQYLAESYLAPQPPWDAPDRLIAGRDAPADHMPL
jgi:phage tail-like protein